MLARFLSLQSFLLLSQWATLVSAWAPTPRDLSKITTSSFSPHSDDQHKKDPSEIVCSSPFGDVFLSFRSAVATGIFAATLAFGGSDIPPNSHGTSVMPPPSASAAMEQLDTSKAPGSRIKVVEISKGALVIQTSPEANQALVKSTIDSKSLLQTLFQNRKPLGESLQRIQSAVVNELTNEPAWKKVQQEILDVEGDVASLVTVQSPSDWRETVRDVSKGRLNLIVNGEVINVAVESTQGTDEDKLRIDISGFKGIDRDDIIRFLPKGGAPQTRYGPIRGYLAKYEGFWTFWNSAYPSKYMPGSIEATNGDVILGGAGGTVGLAYLSAYSYYQYERQEAEAEAEAKRAATQAKKAAAAAKKGNTKAVKAKAENDKATPSAGDDSSTPDAEGDSSEEPSSPKRKRGFRRLLFWRK